MKRRADELSFSGFTPHFSHGFDRKQAHVGGAIHIYTGHNKKHPELSLGVHLQADQYRRMVSFSGFKVPSRAVGKDQKELVQFISATDAWKWMLGCSHKGGSFQRLGGQRGFFKDRPPISTSQQKSKLLLSYAPSHIYQYTHIGRATGVPTDQVIEAVIKDL